VRDGTGPADRNGTPQPVTSPVWGDGGRRAAPLHSATDARSGSRPARAARYLRRPGDRLRRRSYDRRRWPRVWAVAIPTPSASARSKSGLPRSSSQMVDRSTQHLACTHLITPRQILSPFKGVCQIRATSGVAIQHFAACGGPAPSSPPTLTQRWTRPTLKM
jgi:hypothetical protein